VHTIAAKTRFFELIVAGIILHVRTYSANAAPALHRPEGPEEFLMIHASHHGIPLVRLTRATAAIGLLLATGCAHPRDTLSRDDAATRLRLAQLAESAGNQKEELALLAPAAARDPANIGLQTQYATALAQTGQNQQALDVALPAYSRDKTNTGLGLLIGRLYIRQENPAAAASLYQEVIARDGDSLEAINGLGIAEVMQRSLPRAEATFRRATAIAPQDAASRNNLGLALTLERRTDEAISVLEALWREDSTAPRVRTNLAMAYAVAGARDKAMALLTPTMDPAEAARTVEAYAQLDGGPVTSAAGVDTRAAQAALVSVAGKTRPPGS
jgi:Flp pilus assembly protein TadD